MPPSSIWLSQRERGNEAVLCSYLSPWAWTTRTTGRKLEGGLAATTGRRLTVPPLALHGRYRAERASASLASDVLKHLDIAA